MTAVRGMARLDERGRLVLPAALRRRLGVRPGDDLMITEEAEGVLRAQRRREAAAADVDARGLTLGDRACLALAQRLDAPAVTTEHAWADLSVDVAVHVIRG